VVGDTHEAAPAALGAVTATAPAPVRVDGAWPPGLLQLGTAGPVEAIAGPGAALASLADTSPVRTAVSRMAVDALGLVAAAVVAGAVQALSHGVRTGARVDSAFGATEVQLLLSLPVLLLTLSPSRSHSRGRLVVSWVEQGRQAALELAAGGMTVLGVWRLVALAGGDAPSVNGILAFTALSVATVMAGRLVADRPPRRQGRRARRVLILGSGDVARRLADRLTARNGVEVVGYVDDEPLDTDGWLGCLDELPALCSWHDVDHVLVAFSRSPVDRVLASLRPLQGELPISVVPRLFDVLPPDAVVHDVGAGVPAISMARTSFGAMPAIVKRAVDIVGAGAALAVLSPVLVAAAVAVRLSSPGPVLLHQTRIGRGGRPFDMVKFRTMWMSKDGFRPVAAPGELARGPFAKLKHDPRVVPVGRILRRLSVDELPQLVNVLRGQMSLVGPRPFVPDDAASIDGWARRRYEVRPGMTGLWQVSGRNDLTFEEMCRLDHLYVSGWSVGLDARILGRTLRAVMTGRGAY
jgi:exopolysaccharide biosynthesis polyprenyl glycosylphosphotransferase